MKKIAKRLEILEQAVHGKTGVGVLMPVNGAWRLHFNKKYTDYATQTEAEAAFLKKTSPDATLIIWG